MPPRSGQQRNLTPRGNGELTLINRAEQVCEPKPDTLGAAGIVYVGMNQTFGGNLPVPGADPR
jgi:hypothetical protein